jgi:NAD-dependent dihydropyrimidine dehydrogenase PreA subunit
VAYVINDPCTGAKHASCVDVCPVDCIHPTPDEPGFAEAAQLYIDPEECIDCDACMVECPVDAIMHAELLPPEWQHFEVLNAAYYKREAA